MHINYATSLALLCLLLQANPYEVIVKLNLLRVVFKDEVVSLEFLLLIWVAYTLPPSMVDNSHFKLIINASLW